MWKSADRKISCLNLEFMLISEEQVKEADAESERDRVRNKEHED